MCLQKSNVVVCLQKPSIQQPKIVQCFQCQTHGHIAADCDKVQRCPRCGGNHHFKQRLQSKRTLLRKLQGKAQR